MSQLDIFGLGGRVALVPGGGGAIGSAIAEAFAGAGAQGRGRRPDARDARGRRRAGPGRRLRRPRPRRRRDQRGGRRPDRRRDRRALRPPRHRRQRRRRRRRQGRSARPRPTRATTGTGSWSSTSGAPSCRPRPPSRAMIERGPRRRRAQHLVGPRQPRHQRRLLRVRRREGRDQLADPPVGDRMGQARHPRQRDHADLRRHARRWRCCSPTPRSRPGSSAGSRWAGSARPRDLVGPAIFLCSDAASFVTGQILGIDGGLTATQ